jgi:mRNA deadenylase 3'-5' endonuclease subunit Ccr4
LEDQRSLDFNEKANGEPNFVTHNIGQIVRLRRIVSDGQGEALVITNTHLFWKPHYSYLRLVQMHTLLQAVHEEMTKDEALVVLCGGEYTNV